MLIRTSEIEIIPPSSNRYTIGSTRTVKAKANTKETATSRISNIKSVRVGDRYDETASED
jgi:hypothetical protein